MEFSRKNSRTNFKRQKYSHLCFQKKSSISELPTIADEITNLSLSQLSFSKFGKNEIKKWRLSPDAICQMAIQLTNFKIRNKLSMTYEAALARIFKVFYFLIIQFLTFQDGRTETIRSCTTASAAFVKEMLDKNSDNRKHELSFKI